MTEPRNLGHTGKSSTTDFYLLPFIFVLFTNMTLASLVSYILELKAFGYEFAIGRLVCFTQIRLSLDVFR